MRWKKIEKKFCDMRQRHERILQMNKKVFVREIGQSRMKNDRLRDRSAINGG